MMDLSLIAAVASALFLAWIVAGYPLLLALMARREKPVQKGSTAKTVSVIVAVRDGQYYLRKKIESLLNQDYPKHLIDITIISDGSVDDTEEIAREFSSQGVKLLRQPRLGKAVALNTAIPHTSGEILLLTDVRQVLSPDCLSRLVRCFSDPEVGAASGTLLIRGASTQGQANVGAYWSYETWIRRNLSRIDSIFGATGPLYAIRRELVVQIPSHILLDDMYLPLSGFFRGYRLVVDETAIAYDYPTTPSLEFRRKVRTLGGNYQILRHYPKLLGPGNRMWFHYLSYKVGRLMMPFALIGFAVASYWLTGMWFALAIAGQAMLYGMAAIDYVLPERFPLKRLSSGCKTLVVMMAAALCATAVFFIAPARLWKVTSAINLGKHCNDWDAVTLPLVTPALAEIEQSSFAPSPEPIASATEP